MFNVSMHKDDSLSAQEMHAIVILVDGVLIHPDYFNQVHQHFAG
jgi:hypothetical protein